MNSVAGALKNVPRRNFVPEDYQDQADWDVALPIGFGQTISQPYTVGLMLEWLEVEAGNKVLDVGSGSGWTSALLSYLVGPKGRVYAVEIIPELVDFGRANCQRIGIKNARFYQAGKTFGLPRFAPYDRILVGAADGVPKELLDQLNIGGKMIIPSKNDILEIEKTSSNNYETITHPGFVFVPLVQP